MSFEVKFIVSQESLLDIIKKVRLTFDLEEIYDEQGNTILIDRGKKRRISFYVNQNSENGVVNGIAILKDEDDVNVLKKFVEITSIVRKKPTIIEFANIVSRLSIKYSSKEKVLEELKTLYGINSSELESYLKALKKISKSKRSKESVLKALKFLTE